VSRKDQPDQCDLTRSGCGRPRGAKGGPWGTLELDAHVLQRKHSHRHRAGVKSFLRGHRDPPHGDCAGDGAGSRASAPSGGRRGDPPECCAEFQALAWISGSSLWISSAAAIAEAPPGALRSAGSGRFPSAPSCAAALAKPGACALDHRHSRPGQSIGMEASLRRGSVE
ncbi:unnamed protein product, partial [Symbiodinium necroappetens]